MCENYYPHFGGAEVVLSNLAEGYVKRGHEVSVVTHKFPQTPTQETHHGVIIKRVHSANSRYLFSFTGIWRTIKETKNIDIIQATTFNAAFPAWIAAKIRRKPVVLMVHEIWIGKWQKVTGFSWFKSAIHNLLERLIYIPNYDAYVSVSDATKKDLLSHGIKQNRIHRIYNGFDSTFWNPENFSPTQTQAIRKKYRTESEFLFFAWGRPGASKGFETLIDSMQELHKSHPHARLLMLLGSKDSYKPRYDALVQRIKDKKLEQVITIEESVPYEKLGNYILAADCVIIPSLAEGFGYTTLEAISLGTPVIVSDAGSLPEVVSGKYRMFKAGSTTELSKAMIHVMNNEFSTKEKKTFSWDETIKQYLTLYEKLLFLASSGRNVNNDNNESVAGGRSLRGSRTKDLHIERFEDAKKVKEEK